MAKIITENFKVETTNELFNSFKSQNDVLGAKFETDLTTLNTATFGSALTAGNITEVTNIVKGQLESLRPEAEYYIMASRALSNVDSVPTIQNTQKDKRDFQRKVIFGNKVDTDSARYMFYENPWTPDTIYDAYDDTKDFENTQTIVTIRSQDDDYLVFKCIENNNGSVSTTSPQSVIADLATSGYQSVETSDKYIWHYMFTVSASEAIIYKTSNSLPLPTTYGDPNVIANSREGVSQILIESTPTNHFNQFVFNIGGKDNSRVSVVTQSGDDSGRKTVRLSVTNNSVLSNIDDYYKDMYLRASTGSTGGKLYNVLSSQSTPGTSEIVVVVKTSDTLPVSCELVPKVSVSGPQEGGLRCLAYGIINRYGTLERVSYQEKGTNYKFASAELVNPRGLTDNSVTSLRVVISPKGGHGSNPINEMAMSRLAIVTNFSGEASTIPKTNFYTQVGLVKNASFNLKSGSGPYVSNTSSPSSFDNRTKITVNDDQTGIAILGYYCQQFVETVDVTEKVSGTKYRINDIGNLSDSEWQNIMGVADSDKVDGQIAVGVCFIANSASVDSSKTGRISTAVDSHDRDKDIEIVKGLIHSSVYSANTNKTLISIVDDTGDHSNDFLPGKIEIKPTAISESGNTVTINTFNDIQYGAYTSYSGELLHYIDFSPIERKDTTKEKIKFIFDF